MSRRKTKLKKTTEILNASTVATWCHVDINNEFTFQGIRYIIDKNLKEYKVYNKAGEVEDYTNTAKMDLILVTKDTNNNISFYNQNLELISNKKVKQEGE